MEKLLLLLIRAEKRILESATDPIKPDKGDRRNQCYTSGITINYTN